MTSSEKLVFGLIYHHLLKVDASLASIFKIKTKCPELSKTSPTLLKIYQHCKETKHLSNKFNIHKPDSISNGTREDEKLALQIEAVAASARVIPTKKTDSSSSQKSSNDKAAKKEESSDSDKSEDYESDPKKKKTTTVTEKPVVPKQKAAFEIVKPKKSFASHSFDEKEKPKDDNCIYVPAAEIIDDERSKRKKLQFNEFIEKFESQHDENIQNVVKLLTDNGICGLEQLSKLDIPTFERKAKREILYGESITLEILVKDAKKHFKELIDIDNEKQQEYEELSESMTDKLKKDIANLSHTKLISSKRYVDKTRFIKQLIESEGQYTLVRPRRFGKSLLLRTIRDICMCKHKALFKEYAIGKSTYNWVKYPVIYIDFSIIDSTSAISFEKRLSCCIKTIAEEYGVDLNINGPCTSLFELLIKSLYSDFKQPVVVLIDEYDYPMTHTSERDKNEILGVIKTIYNTLKSYQSIIQMALSTGITTFSLSTIYSGANNIKHLTLNENYAEICGFTEREIRVTLLSRLEEFAKSFYNENGKKINIQNDDTLEKIAKEIPEVLCHKKTNLDQVIDIIMKYIKLKYNGYKFSHNNCQLVYNPFSVLKCVENRRFENWWFKLDKPNVFVQNILSNKDEFHRIFNNEGFITTKVELDTRDDGERDLVVSMFQAGYLTIVKKDNDVTYLQFPNHEVSDNFFKFFASMLVTKCKVHMTKDAKIMVEELANLNIKPLMRFIIQCLLPTNSKALPDNEYGVHIYCYGLLQGHCTSIGNCKMSCEAEISLGGFSDMRLIINNESNKIYYIVEFKYLKTKELTRESAKKKCQDGIEQVMTRRYYSGHLNDNDKVMILVIVACNREIVHYELLSVEYCGEFVKETLKTVDEFYKDIVLSGEKNNTLDVNK